MQFFKRTAGRFCFGRGALTFSMDYKYLLTTIAGENSAVLYSVDEKTGMLFDMKNSKDLAEKLNRFVNDEDLSKELGEQARNKVVDIYSVDKHMDKVVKILKGEHKE